MPMPTEEDMKFIKANTETLQKLTDSQIIMLALSELVMCVKDMPIGTRIPLHSSLRQRTGLK